MAPVITENKIGTYSFHIENYMTDFRGDLPLASLISYLIHVASEEATRTQFGYNNLIMNNQIWVLTRLAVELKKYPKAEDKLVIKTWVETITKYFAFRNFSFSIANQEIGYARSIWAVIDVDTRKACNLFTIDCIPQNRNDVPCPIDSIKKIRTINTQPLLHYSVKYSDLDINKHFNTVKYVEHILNLFPLALFEQKKVSRTDILFINEARYGMEIDFHKQIIKEEEEFTIEMTNLDKGAICRCRLIFEQTKE